MGKRVKPEGQDIMDWLSELVASDPEAQKAYDEEMSRYTVIPRTKNAALEAVTAAAHGYLGAIDKHIGQLELWRHKPLGSKAQTLYDEHANAIDGWRSRLQDALVGLEFHEDAYKSALGQDDA